MKTPWQKTFDPNYLGSWSLEGREELAATVTKVETAEMFNGQGEKRERIVIHLDRAPKNGLLLPMVIGNKENAKMMEKITGSCYIEDWVGASIIVYVKTGVKSFGQVVDALRIKPGKPAKKKPISDADFPKLLNLIEERKFSKQRAIDSYALTPVQLSEIENIPDYE